MSKKAKNIDRHTLSSEELMSEQANNIDNHALATGLRLLLLYSPQLVACLSRPFVHQYLLPLLSLDRPTLASLTRFVKYLVHARYDKHRSAHWLHQVLLPFAARVDNPTFWEALSLLAIYLGENHVALSAAKRAENPHLHHYLAWGVGAAVPNPADPLGGRNYHAARGASPTRGVTIAILDYKTPDNNPLFFSSNIGDIIQSVAFMRHLARFFSEHWLVGDARVSAALRFLRDSWPAAARQPIDAAINIKIVDRDSAWAGSRADETVWLPLYGWFALRPFSLLPVFPLPPQLQPFFISFHLCHYSRCHYKDILNRDAIAWLKTIAPIGCRDTTTRDRLTEVGIPAFFAGCITTTLKLPEHDLSPPQTPRHAHYRVDTKAADTHNYTSIGHDAWRGGRMRRQPFAASLFEAIDLLQAYQQATSVRTSRLHCYLPCRALGTDVTFVPKKRNNPRFRGLHNLSPAELHHMQTTLSNLTEQLLATILTTTDPTAARAKWRQLTAPLVDSDR